MKILILVFLAVLFLVSDAFALGANLSWQDNSGNEDGFIVESAPNALGTFSVLGKTGANVSTFSDPASAPGKCYRVAAFNLVGQSGYSNVACAATAPGAPAQLIIVITP